MRKVFAILAASLMLAVMAPNTSANETVEESYTGALGASVEDGTYVGLVLFPNSEDSPYTQAGIRPIGGVRLNADAAWTNLIIELNDALYGENAAASTCFWNPDGDSTCNPDEDYPSDIACGGAALLGSPFAGDYATVFMFTAHVTADLDFCGGSTGSVSGTFF